MNEAGPKNKNSKRGIKRKKNTKKDYSVNKTTFKKKSLIGAAVMGMMGLGLVGASCGVHAEVWKVEVKLSYVNSKLKVVQDVPVMSVMVP